MAGRPRPRRSLVAAVAVLAAWLASACGPQPTPGASPPLRPNVLLITIDTLRADRLGRGFTPTLDDLAARGLCFTQARTAVPLTLPSHATILSGLLPPHHGVRLNGASRVEGHPTLATILHAHGYRTLAAVGAFVLARQFGLDAGFDAYDDEVPRDVRASTVLEAERSATAVTDAALALLRRDGSGQPWFLWAHYYDPHAPYAPPPAFVARANGHRYDGEVAYVDAEVARLLRELPGGASDGRSGPRTLVVVAGDHGESLGEHGEDTHGMLLYEAALRVPLFFTWRSGGPRLRPAVRHENVSLADLAPTLLALLDLTPPAPTDGVSLLAGVPADREVYAETTYPRVAGWSPLASLVTSRWKAIRGGRVQLFDLKDDGMEQRDVSGQRGSTASAMARRLATFSAAASERAAPLSSETRDRLRALGYVTPVQEAAPRQDAADPADRIGDWRLFESASAAFAGAGAGGLAGGKLPNAGALQRLESLARRNPQAQVFHTAWARALAVSGRHEEALRAYRDGVTRWPGDAQLLHDLAVAARDAGRAEEALRAEQAALAVDPRFPAALNGLGLLYAEAGRAADAADAFERAVLGDRSDPSYWSNLGNARRALANLAGARRAFDAALALDGSWPDAANGVGVLEVQEGRAAAAVAWFEKALARSPDLVEARLNLGIALQEAGQTERARSAYRAVLRAPARFARERAAARQLLQALR